MKRIPLEIVKEIFGFVYPDKNKIVFHDHYPNFRDPNYSWKYQLACINNNVLFQEDRLLSRILKKNGKHRYYITTRIEERIHNYCTGKYFKIQHGGYYDDENNRDIINIYTSKYSGKDLDMALLEFYSKG
jgi:hypothetical protein